MTAAIDGSEEVWSAILASTLTHIAVFVPMLFLTGVSSIMFGQLAAVVSFSLAMSLLVAVTIVPVLCSRLLDAPERQARGEGRDGQRSTAPASAGSSAVDDFYARCAASGAAPPADRLRGRLRPVRGRDRADPAHRFRIPAADRRGRSHGRCRTRRRLAHRAHRSGPDRPRERHSRVGARGDDADHAGQRRRWWWRVRRRARRNRGNVQIRLVPRTERTRIERRDRHAAPPRARPACPA